MADKFYTTSEVAKAVGVSRQTIQTWIAEGKIKAPPLVGTTRIWSKSQLEELKRKSPKSK
jgi:excisionase family DNA binding protein